MMRAAAMAGTTLILLALIELALAAAGIEGLAAERDHFAGFSQRVRVFRAESDRGVYATPPAAVQRSFNYQEFQIEKPAFRKVLAGEPGNTRALAGLAMIASRRAAPAP